jgi:uncharacterized FlaG/YvyC family protein
VFNMASDGIPVSVPVTRPVHGSQAPTSATVQESGGKSLPANGHAAAAAAATPAVRTKSAPDLPALVAQLNKYFRESGRPNQFRLDTSSGSKQIQEINPDSGEVIGEYSAAEFPLLFRSLGVPGVLIDSHA